MRIFLSWTCAVLFTGFFTAAFAQSSKCLIARYTFNTDAKDTSGHNLNGNDSNITHVPDRFLQAGHAYGFNKSIVYSPNFGTDTFGGVTITGWMSTSTASVQSTVVQIPPYVIFVSRFTSGRLLASFDGSTATNSSADESKTNVNTGKWFHFAATNDGDTTRLYINGVLENKFYEQLYKNSNTNISIGNMMSKTFAYNGLLDEVRVYKCALSAAEIKNIYNDSSDFIKPDAGITSIDSLLISYCGKSVTPDLYVTLKNYSVLKNLDSVHIAWSVNGGTVSQKKYSGVIKPGGTGAFFLGQITLTSGINKIKVWTFRPNGNFDLDHSNDTLVNSVSVDPIPSVDFSVTNACENEPVGITNKTTVSSGTVKFYTWRFGDGTKSTSATPVKTYLKAGTYSITLHAATLAGCEDSITKTVTILPKPAAAFTAADVCGGKQVIFTNKTMVSGGSLTYSWDFGDGATSTLASPAHLYSAPGAYNVILTAYASSGCSDTIVQQVNIYENPKAIFTANNVCGNAPVSFVNNSTFPQGAFVKYSWDFGDKTIGSTTSPSHSYLKTGIYHVRLVVTTDKGCSDTVIHDVSVFIKPHADFTVADVCQGNQAIFKNTGDSVGIKYLWKFGDGKTDTVRNPGHMFSLAGSYAVTLFITNTSGCTDSIQKSMKVLPKPAANFTFSISKRTATFTPADTTGSAYYWDFGDDNTSFLKAPKHLYAADSVYHVKLRIVNSNGCESTFTDTLIINASGIAQYNIPGLDFALFPNPTSGGLNLLCTGNDCGGRILVEIMDLTGRYLFETEFSGDGTQTLETSGLQPGLYLVRISAGNMNVFRTFVKE